MLNTAKKYAEKHIINIRDYIIEDSPLFRLYIKKLVASSALSTISSKGFLKFLPEHHYRLVHSFNDTILDSTKFREKNFKVDSQVIKIGFIGNCRSYKENMRLINELMNDNRFELWYCGTNCEFYANLAKEKLILNLFTQPPFNVDQTLEVISNFHMINSLFGSEELDNRTLVPIRLYTSLIMGLPLIVSSGTTLADIVSKNNIGFVVEDFEDLGNSIYNYYSNLDFLEFYNSSKIFLEQARLENEHFFDDFRSVLHRRGLMK